MAHPRGHPSARGNTPAQGTPHAVSDTGQPQRGLVSSSQAHWFLNNTCGRFVRKSVSGGVLGSREVEPGGIRVSPLPSPSLLSPLLPSLPSTHYQAATWCGHQEGSLVVYTTAGPEIGTVSLLNLGVTRITVRASGGEGAKAGEASGPIVDQAPCCGGKDSGQFQRPGAEGNKWLFMWSEPWPNYFRWSRSPPGSSPRTTAAFPRSVALQGLPSLLSPVEI